MAGVTDVPFRTLCRRFGAGLYVNQMITARGLVERQERTLKLAEFGPGESPRSIQLYGTDPEYLERAVRQLVDEEGVDHIDMNFGCSVPKVTRHGGGAALPFKRRLLRRILRAAVRAAGGRVPVTIKFRIGLDDHTETYLDTGRMAEEEGIAAIALHARTAEQFYSGAARWDAIARLKQAVSSIPVLGNGDIWEAADAVEMQRQTGCDGVVVGRGCLGRPWLFGDLADLYAGKDVAPPPRLGAVVAVLRDHAASVVEWHGTEDALRSFRKHAIWYLTGYPCGGAARAKLNRISTLHELDEVLDELDPTLTLLPGALRTPRSHSNGPKPLALPHRWLDEPDEDLALAAAAEAYTSGG
jgi:nifR3 family TIM-barrel protein